MAEEPTHPIRLMNFVSEEQVCLFKLDKTCRYPRCETHDFLCMFFIMYVLNWMCSCKNQRN